MAFYSVREFIREVRKPGKIEADVNSEHDVFCILIEKSDLLDKLTALDGDSESPWYFNLTHEDGTRRLSVITDYERASYSNVAAMIADR